jgi:hypothetical protein
VEWFWHKNTAFWNCFLGWIRLFWRFFKIWHRMRTFYVYDPILISTKKNKRDMWVDLLKFQNFRCDFLAVDTLMPCLSCLSTEKTKQTKCVGSPQIKQSLEAFRFVFFIGENFLNFLHSHSQRLLDMSKQTRCVGEVVCNGTGKQCLCFAETRIISPQERTIVITYVLFCGVAQGEVKWLRLLRGFQRNNFGVRVMLAIQFSYSQTGSVG